MNISNCAAGFTITAEPGDRVAQQHGPIGNESFSGTSRAEQGEPHGVLRPKRSDGDLQRSPPSLVTMHHERYHNNYVPADHTDINQVHHPQAPPHSQHQEDSNHLAEHNTPHVPEVDS